MSGATENADGSKKDWKHGHAIENGILRFLSVSAIEKGDPSQETGCPRKWAAHYGPWKIKEPSSAATERGNAAHLEVATYLRGVERPTNQLVLQGMHFFPPPGSCLVEHDMVPDLPDGTSGLANAPLRAAGIAVTGAIDLIHDHPENFGVDDPSCAVDEPGVLKITDWKFPASMRNAVPGPELVRKTQMAGYATWAFEVFPKLERVRLSHGYMPVKGKPKLMTTLATREQVERTWKRASAVAVLLRDAARETDLNKVEANTRACHAYGRDCPVKVAGMCAAADVVPLAKLIGRTAAEQSLAEARSLPLFGEPRNMTVPTTTSLLDQLKARQANTGAPPSPSPLAGLTASTAPATPAIPAAPDPAAVAAEKLRLEKEEITAKYGDVLQTVKDIEACGLGCPTFTGELARVLCLLQGHELKGGGLAGSGPMAAYTFDDPAVLPAVLADARKITADQAAQATQPSTQETPAPTEPAPVQETASTESPTEPAAKKPRGPGRPKKDKTEPKTEVVAQIVTGPQPGDGTGVRTVTTPAGVVATVDVNAVKTVVVHSPAPTAINFYVDCAVTGIPTESFWPLVNHLLDVMNKQSGQKDFRLASKDSAFGFNGWKGVLAAYLNETAIPPGNYTFDGSFGEIANVVIEAMRGIVERSGGAFVRGVR